MPQIKFKNNFRKKSPQRYNKDMRKQVLSSSYFLLGEIKRLSVESNSKCKIKVKN